jgi:hypothetical protein
MVCIVDPISCKIACITFGPSICLILNPEKCKLVGIEFPPIFRIKELLNPRLYKKQNMVYYFLGLRLWVYPKGYKDSNCRNYFYPEGSLNPKGNKMRVRPRIEFHIFLEDSYILKKKNSTQERVLNLQL